ncbi:3-phosphoshikimate 1-carboxyvinyltransferase [Halobacillus shinanisalinarum]|uniref:3-phosphoshikimate 1-carboxyvinyltransferase n=1 Tax=Halobacillus shinanisalinarum TaxID=2932258 RepID=A0ABY4H0Z0_9BACI|nr:3-phosphoshikimate 1-carboxyvinyltransferase [Halobacillus shinanisalinarum]UOQ93575.1 3-phosphoshikimate 1-carboxyvinyltransferase [Halobacillus shinanisalinarum]
MTTIELQPATKGLHGALQVPGDKSISHRAVIFSSLAEGTSYVYNFLTGEDCLRTVEAFRKLGVRIDQEADKLTIYGRGIKHLTEPAAPIYFGNSGTTARLMSGVLAGLPLFTVAYGDESLAKRPMDRVVVPLEKMGAHIYGRTEATQLPLAFKGRKLSGVTIEMNVKSAQVKSALLLAGMLAEGETKVYERGITRNHTEMLMPQYGITINKNENVITVPGNQQPMASDLHIPGDISSAAFFFVAGLLTQDSELTIKNVGLNPTRDGIITTLQRMGANLAISNQTYVGHEPVGDVTVKSGPLEALTVEGDIIANLIDEIPILALAATQAEGTTVIKDAKELRVKETDRIAAVAQNLIALGANIESTDDGLIIHGPTPLTGAVVHSYGDHRIGMMNAIASLITDSNVTIEDKDCINISYPNFFEHLSRIMK